MFKKLQTFLYKLDLIGLTPQLFIFNKKIYSSLFSSILSFLICLFSVFFIVFSLNQYFKYDNPSIVYSKANDEETKREIFIKDILFMFQLVDSTTLNPVSEEVGYIEAEHADIYDNGTVYSGNITLEKCELGKNIDLKYEEYVNNKYKFGRKLDEFYCISPENGNISLFYYPNIGYNIINLFIKVNNNSSYIPEKLQTLIVSETDLIDHNNKNDPIGMAYIYHLTSSYSSLEYTNINYNFQYLQYESDDGYFYKNTEILNGMAFSDMNFYMSRKEDYNFEEDSKNSIDSIIGTITFQTNKSYYDSYKRSYQRMQSLLA